MFKQAKLALAATALAAATLPAMAAPLYINTGQDFRPEPNGSTNTTVFDQLGYSGTLATSRTGMSPDATATAASAARCSLGAARTSGNAAPFASAWIRVPYFDENENGSPGSMRAWPAKPWFGAA